MIQENKPQNQDSPFKIEIEEKDNYTSRVKKGNLLAIGLYIIFIFFMYSYTNSNGFLIGSILFGLATFFLIRYLDKLDLNPSRDRYFITLIEQTKDGKIHIEYKDKMDSKEMNGRRAEFDFQKRWTTFTNPSRPYLQIIYKRKTIISQYRKGDWSEDNFDEIMKHMGKNQI